MKKKYLVLAARPILMTFFFSFIVLLCSGAIPRTAWARSNGITGYSGSSGSICTACHTASGTAPTATLTGPTSLAPGASGVYTFTITGGAAVVGGLDVSTTSGTLQATDPNTQLSGVEVTHTSATHSFTSGSLAFTFTLVAPASGTVTLYAAGLSANGDGLKSGDNAVGKTLAVNVTASAPQIVITDSVAPTTDHQIPFGTVTDGNTSDQTVTVSNTGNANLVVGSIASANPLAAPFSITVDNCSGQTIAPAGACTLTVRFAPVAVGAFSDTFNIPSNDTVTGTVNMSVSGTGAATPVPVISVTDSVAPTTDHQIPFGTVTDGVTSDQTVTVSNTGNANLVVGSIASANPLVAPFSITVDNCSGQTIAPAGACTLTVRFAPVAVGAFSDTFNIPSNDTVTGTVTMSVSGTGTATPVPVISVTDSVAPTTDHQIPFGTVTDGVTSDKTVTVSNTGNANLVVGSIASANPLVAPFSITVDNCSGQTIAPAGSCTLTVRFAPVAVGAFSDAFNIPSNDIATGTVTMSVSGTGAAPVPVIVVTDSVAPNNDLSIPFGTVLNGLTSDKTVTISNSGSADLLVGTIAIANPLVAPFSITVDNCSGKTIAPAGACTLTVRFAPVAAGAFSDIFDIPSNDPSTPSTTVSLSGTGSSTLVPVIAVTDSVAPNNDLSIPFGTVTDGNTSDQTVTVSNTGNADLLVGSIAGANPLPAPFSITVDNCSGQSIAPAGACTLTVRFAPVAAGAFSDTFDIPSNDPSTPSATVSVNGTGNNNTQNNPPTTPSLVSPADGETGVGTTVTLEWERSTDPDGDAITYNLYYCTDSTFASCAPVVAFQGTTGIYFAGSGLVFLGFVMTRGGRGRKFILVLMMAMLLTTSVLFVSCRSKSSSTPVAGTNMTYQVSGLNKATTYYWKVIADDGKGGLASSATRSFSTQ